MGKGPFKMKGFSPFTKNGDIHKLKKELKDCKINPKKDTKYLINEKTNVISTSTLVKE